MFENFTKIPHTETEASLMMTPMSDISDKFHQLIPSQHYRVNWFGSYLLTNIAVLLNAMDALNADTDDKAYLYYMSNDEYGFQRMFEQQVCHGLIILEAPSTKFNHILFPSAEYLSNAEEFLKQTSHHFLKIFTKEGSNYLYVWTNKEITPDTLYKLYALYASIFNKENKLLIDFVNSLIADDITTAKKILKDYFLSDAVIEKEYEAFKRCLRNQHDAQILSIERNLRKIRNDIDAYENAIAQKASDMRELNEKLCFYKYMQPENDDHKILFKHLKKIPYIKSFEPDQNGYIHFEYEAPMLYFSEMPAEKLANQPSRSNYWKEIIKMIIGRKYELITKCAIQFNTGNFNVSSDSIYNTSPVIGHPHIARFNCFGNHRQAIADSATTGDYIGAIEQITQTVLNLNFYDVCVVDTLCNTLEQKRSSLKTWRHKETGEMFTTEEVYNRGDYYEKA